MVPLGVEEEEEPSAYEDKVEGGEEGRLESKTLPTC